LPAFEKLLQKRVNIDYMVLPQVPSARGFRLARGADTDWFEGLSRAMLSVLNKKTSPIFIFRSDLDACFETIIYANYVPRATYLKDPMAINALRAAIGLNNITPSKIVTLVLRSLGGGNVRRAGPGWTNSASLVTELRLWLTRNFPGWQLNVVALGHAFSFTAQAALVTGSAVLVAAHGAWLTNAIFAANGAAVVEVLNCGHRSNTYRNLVRNRGLSYFSATKLNGIFRGDDCSQDQGRRNVDARRPLPLSELAPALAQAISVVDIPSTSNIDHDQGCRQALLTKFPTLQDVKNFDLAERLDVLASALEKDSSLADCVALRATSAVSVHLATLKQRTTTDIALHASRRKLILAFGRLYNQESTQSNSRRQLLAGRKKNKKKGVSIKKDVEFKKKNMQIIDFGNKDETPFSRIEITQTKMRLLASPYGWMLEAFGNSFIEGQRLARHILFHHMSKAAGTSFCKLAKLNGCSGPKQFSTLWAAGDGPTWGNCARGGRSAHEHSDTIGRGRRNRNCAARELECPQRLRAYSEHEFDFMAIERWLDNGGQLCTPELWYATLIREPLRRIISHHNHLWRHTLRTTQRFDHTRTRAQKNGAYFTGIFENATHCVRVSEMPFALGAAHRTGYDWSMVCALSSNFATRSLLGTRFSPRPYDGETPTIVLLQEDILKLALDTLYKFAIVIVVEKAAETGPILQHALAWSGAARSGLPRVGRDASASRKVVSIDNLPSNDVQLLKKHNVIDLALYDAATRIFDADLHFYNTVSLFRDPVLDDRRKFCDARKSKDANFSLDEVEYANTDDPDDWNQEDLHLL